LGARGKKTTGSRFYGVKKRKELKILKTFFRDQSAKSWIGFKGGESNRGKRWEWITALAIPLPRSNQSRKGEKDFYLAPFGKKRGGGALTGERTVGKKYGADLFPQKERPKKKNPEEGRSTGRKHKRLEDGSGSFPVTAGVVCWERRRIRQPANDVVSGNTKSQIPKILCNLTSKKPTVGRPVG